MVYLRKMEQTESTENRTDMSKVLPIDLQKMPPIAYSRIDDLSRELPYTVFCVGYSKAA